MEIIRKLALIGIDAGDLHFIQKNLSSLPNIKRLMEQGSTHILQTTSGLLTGSVWPTFYTGKLPGDHGIYHHLQWDPARMKTKRVTDRWLYSEPFWYRLAENGLKVTVLDVPMTFPARIRNGVEIINWGSHDQLGHLNGKPETIVREIRRRFGTHPMGIEVPVDKTEWQFRHIRNSLISGAHLKGRLIRHLITKTKWDLFIAVFGECHRGGHILWPENTPGSRIPSDALLNVYKAVDESISTVLNVLGDTPVALFSLHGMEQNRSQEHFMQQVIERTNALFNGNFTLNRAGQETNSGIMRMLRRSVPSRLQNIIARAVPVEVRDWVVSRAVTGGYNWGTTPGFSLLADYNGYIRINLKGRELTGALKQEESEYSGYLDLLESVLSGLRVKRTGEKLVKDITRASDVFPGARQDNLPDLIVTWQPAETIDHIESAQIGQINTRLDTGRSGNHRHEGFMITHNFDTLPDGVKHINQIAGWVGEYFGVKQ